MLACSVLPVPRRKHVFAILFRILTGAAITKMKGVSASNCTQVCKVETCQPPLVCAARAVRRPISSHCYPCDAIGAGARTLHAFQPLYKLPAENCVRLSTNIIPAELYSVSELKFLTTGQGRKCVSLSRNRGEIILNTSLVGRFHYDCIGISASVSRAS